MTPTQLARSMATLVIDATTSFPHHTTTTETATYEQVPASSPPTPNAPAHSFNFAEHLVVHDLSSSARAGLYAAAAICGLILLGLLGFAGLYMYHSIERCKRGRDKTREVESESGEVELERKNDGEVLVAQKMTIQRMRITNGSLEADQREAASKQEILGPDCLGTPAVLLAI